MKAISIDAAREIGKKSGAERLVIIALDGERYCITTWGKTRMECRALARWAEKKSTVSIIQTISDAPLIGGIAGSALDPATPECAEAHAEGQTGGSEKKFEGETR